MVKGIGRKGYNGILITKLLSLEAQFYQLSSIKIQFLYHKDKLKVICDKFSLCLPHLPHFPINAIKLFNILFPCKTI